MDTSFAKQWLEAPDEIRVLLTADEFQPLICPECYVISKADDSAPCECPCRRYYFPRLDQLVGMLSTPYMLTNYKDGSCCCALFIIDADKSFEGKSEEEALLKAICHEHGLEWRNGEWKTKKEVMS